MTLYVLKREDGKYVAKVGMASSYTTKLQHARVFRSREDADRERCPENEMVSTVEQEMIAGSTPRK